MAASAISSQMFCVMYEEASLQHSSPYICIEEALKLYCPDFTLPKKWSNILRFAKIQVEKGKLNSSVFNCQKESQRDSLGYYCNKIGLTKTVLNCLNCACTSKLHTFTVGAFRELCLFRKAEGKTWKDVKEWLYLMLPTSKIATKITEPKMCYCFKNIHEKFTNLSKRRMKNQSEEFLSSDFISYLNKTSCSRNSNKENKSCRIKEAKLSIKNILLQKEIIELNNENELLSDILQEKNTETKQLTRVLKLESKRNEVVSLKQKLSDSNKKITDANKKLKSIKSENFYKRIKRTCCSEKRKKSF